MYYQSQRFHPVRKKRNFVHGDILYKDGEFYLVHRKKKIIPISWCEAGKRIYGHLGKFTRGSFNVSKQKVVFSFEFNEEEEVQTSLKPQTFPLNQLVEREAQNPVQAPDADSELSEPERRAKSLMNQIVSNDPRLSFKGSYIYVKSTNKKIYRISIISGRVYNNLNRDICVTIYSMESLPLFDKIIAKALTIAYAPKRICTLV